ncbi:MAG: hypothetical protein KDM63_20905, partial [Verrucomicrobiae bacterium]|nr:hypothetical protein [Verrucomicrobiae bacterium]
MIDCYEVVKRRRFTQIEHFRDVDRRQEGKTSTFPASLLEPFGDGDLEALRVGAKCLGGAGGLTSGGA